MSEIGIGSLGSILPEIILIVGGLLILLLDMIQNSTTYQRESGRGFMAVAVLFLVVSLVGALLQMLSFGSPTSQGPHVAAYLVDIDPFTSFMKMTIYIGMTLVAIAGGSYMNRYSPRMGRGEFWSLFLFTSMAMGMVVSANNLILLFLSFEFLSISSYILAGYLRNNVRSSEAGLKYFLYGSVASSVMLYGMSLLYGVSGSLNLTEIAQAMAANTDFSIVALPAVLMLMVGLGFKMTLAPFFQWAPDTYDGAPTPVTAYLSTASKAAGFAVTARLLLIGLGAFSVEWVPVLSGLAILTMTVGNLMALRQNSVKRMLAYSSVAQAGYMLMGLVSVVSASHAELSQIDLASLGMNGLNGLLIYLFAYLFTNIGAFMVVMAIEEDSGSHDISAYRGLMQRSPGLALAMLIFLLSLTGIPLTGGFMGKFYVFGAAVQHQYFFLAAAGFINAGIAAGYYLRVVAAMIYEPAVDDNGVEIAPKPLNMGMAVQLTLAICVLVTLWIGIYPPNFIDLANDASRHLLALRF